MSSLDTLVVCNRYCYPLFQNTGVRVPFLSGISARGFGCYWRYGLLDPGRVPNWLYTSPSENIILSNRHRFLFGADVARWTAMQRKEDGREGDLSVAN